MEPASRTDDLNQALAAWNSQLPAFVTGLRGALGVGGGAALDDDTLEVATFMIRRTSNVVTAFVVTSRALTMFELNRDGDSLTVTVPLFRLRRVAESAIQGVVKLTLEIDADRSVVSGRPLDDGSFVGTLSPTIYEMVAGNDDEAAEIRSFGQELRAALLHV